MAKLVAPLFSLEARGKVGGLVYNTTRGVSYVKELSAPKTQYTPRQIEVRSITASLTSTWQSLTNQQRAQWSAYATRHLLPTWTGHPKRLSGYNWFIKTNFVALDIGLSPTSEPPSEVSLTYSPDLSLSWSGADLVVSFIPSAVPEIARSYLDIWASKPTLPTVRPSLKLAKHVAYLVQGSSESISGAEHGEMLTVWGRLFDPVAYRIGSWSSASTVLTATGGSLSMSLRNGTPSGPPISGATAHCGDLSGLSNLAGDVIITGIPPGTYSVWIEADGFVSRTIMGVVIQDGQLTDLDRVVLQPDIL